jgi:hypothetical protein
MHNMFNRHTGIHPLVETAEMHHSTQVGDQRDALTSNRAGLAKESSIFLAQSIGSLATVVGYQSCLGGYLNGPSWDGCREECK